MPLSPVLTKRWQAPRSWTLSTYQQLDGYQALRKALRTRPPVLAGLIREASLRGRGGGGFMTGIKWGLLPDNDRPRYLVVNADEGEPGTCRDAPLLIQDPHALVEGIAIACHAIGARRVFVYLRGEFVHGRRRLQHAIEEAYSAGLLGADILGTGVAVDVAIHSGAGAYICGEESALLDSLEGYRGQPRLRPPYPAERGLYGEPTVVNNVGTLASLPPIVLGGADWWRSMGTETSPGPAIYSVSGRVRRPGQYEAPMGTTLRELIEMAGGIRAGHRLKFWASGGSSLPLHSADEIDKPIEFPAGGDTVHAGTGATMIFDETDCVVRAVQKWSHFYAHESCGKCTPCREGTFWFTQIYDRLERGESTARDLDTLLDVSESMLGKSFCGLGDGATSPVTSSIRLFREEYIAHYEQRGCPYRRTLELVG